MTTYRREVTPEHVGWRVTLRFTDDAGDIRDAVGQLTSHDGTTLTVVTRKGEIRTVSAASLIAHKLISAPNAD